MKVLSDEWFYLDYELIQTYRTIKTGVKVKKKNYLQGNKRITLNLSGS